MIPGLYQVEQRRRAMSHNHYYVNFPYGVEIRNNKVGWLFHYLSHFKLYIAYI